MVFWVPKKALLIGATLKPQDVISIQAYTGNGGTQTITTGLDLENEDGLVWIKALSSTQNHAWFDTTRPGAYLSSSLTNGSASISNGLTAFTSSGFTLGNNAICNANNVRYISYSLKSQNRFFRILRYTGTGSGVPAIPHDLGADIDCAIIKRLDTNSPWYLWHRQRTGNGSTEGYMNLNTVGPFSTTNNPFDFYFGGSDDTKLCVRYDANVLDAQYIAYIFADNRNLTDIGYYIGNGTSTGPVVTCGGGWRPQFAMVKPYDYTGSWIIQDAIRDTDDPRQLALLVNSNAIESTSTSYAMNFLENGFQAANGNNAVNRLEIRYLTLAFREAA